MKTLLQSVLTGLFITTCTLSSLAVQPALALEEIDAYQVILNEDEREDGDDRIADMEMVLINKRGQERLRKVVNYRKDYGEDDKSVMFFLEPADVKNTAFLSWNYDDAEKDDDQWLYLPALKKVRRISSSNRDDYFMGTDFTYTDMGDREIDDYTYTHLEPEVIDGVECYHIERLPKDKDVMKETGYGRTEVWIRPDNWVMVKAVFYDKKLKLLKELTVSDIDQVDGIWTAHTLTMDNIQKKHKTIFNIDNVRYNTGLEDDLFSQRRIQKGIQ
jgi:outer membrane lipoprotein-sorting protein